ncbi:MAG: rRNA maturation RNase YbeY [Bacteroidales bacterium]|nr:rRNA maturation RNase YbeY [Bacteroidales bacterium]MDD4821135.1 rRNA maturation RNase YbeY [Bacteroidales bacterium]
MAISYCAEGTAKVPSFKKREMNSWIKTVATAHGMKIGVITYIFCDDDHILKINKEYLNHDYYTDIITFDYTEDGIISGDIFISLDTVRSNALQFKTSYEEELNRVIIHGILHLCGIEDKTPQARKVMEANENEALSLLKK